MNLCFIVFTLLSFFNCRNSTVGMIDEIGMNDRFYPKQYIILTSKTRKIFNIKSRVIPKYLYYELLISTLFALLGPIYIIIYLCCDENNSVGGLLLLFHSILIITNLIYFAIMSAIFKR